MTGCPLDSSARQGWDLIACPVCEGVVFDTLFEKGGEPFVRCRACGLTLINPRPPFEQVRAGYDAEYSTLYTAKADKKLKRARGRVQRLVRRYGRGKRWLDVGCSAGFVVKAAQDAGYEAHGVDIEAAAVAWGRERYDLDNLRAGLLDEQAYPAASFDVISAYDVIEHVPDLNAFVAELERLLAPQGVIDLGTPDIGHWRVPTPLETWNELKPSEHLYYFDRQTLGRLLARHGLVIDRVRIALKPGLKAYVKRADER